MSKPANGTIFAPCETWWSYNGVRLLSRRSVEEVNNLYRVSIGLLANGLLTFGAQLLQDRLESRRVCLSVVDTLRTCNQDPLVALPLKLSISATFREARAAFIVSSTPGNRSQKPVFN